MRAPSCKEFHQVQPERFCQSLISTHVTYNFTVYNSGQTINVYFRRIQMPHFTDVYIFQYLTQGFI